MKRKYFKKRRTATGKDLKRATVVRGTGWVVEEWARYEDGSTVLQHWHIVAFSANTGNIEWSKHWKGALTGSGGWGSVSSTVFVEQMAENPNYYKWLRELLGDGYFRSVTRLAKEYVRRKK